LTVVHWLESVQGLPGPTALAKLAAPHADRPAYICGPGPFMDAAREALRTLGVGAAQVHIEVFRSLESDPFAAVTVPKGEGDGGGAPATAVVELDGETHTVSWPRNAKLLDVLLANGLDAPFSCKEGHCGACACTLRAGRVRMEVNDVLEQQDLDDGLILACQSLPESDSVDVTYD
ncbi:MAG: iron-sulfur cluster-binding domain-containing protein, partial [Mycobacterium sp.]